MRGTLIGLVLLGGCIVDHHQEPVGGDPTPPDPIILPHNCIADVTLDGGSSGSTTIGPIAVDANGVNVCLHLDATHNLVAAHFMGGTDYVTGTTSPFAATLQDLNMVTLRDGWDVTVDDDPQPRTFTNIEWNAPTRLVTDAILWIHAPSVSASTKISVSLFEPLE